LALPDRCWLTNNDLPPPGALRNIRLVTPKVMSEPFAYDVSLSHSAKDRAVVRDVAERLRQDGVSNNSQLSTSNSQPPPGSDWAQLLTDSQPSTFNPQPIAAPLNKERRFLPLHLDDAPRRSITGRRRSKRNWRFSSRSTGWNMWSMIWSDFFRPCGAWEI
jgi:hypothetical protein